MNNDVGNFTIDDIHKIREENYERTKTMSPEEKIAYYNNSGRNAMADIAKIRLKAGIGKNTDNE